MTIEQRLNLAAHVVEQLAAGETRRANAPRPAEERGDHGAAADGAALVLEGRAGEQQTGHHVAQRLGESRQQRFRVVLFVTPRRHAHRQLHAVQQRVHRVVVALRQLARDELLPVAQQRLQTLASRGAVAHAGDQNLHVAERALQRAAEAGCRDAAEHGGEVFGEERATLAEEDLHDVYVREGEGDNRRRGRRRERESLRRGKSATCAACCRRSARCLWATRSGSSSKCYRRTEKQIALLECRHVEAGEGLDELRFDSEVAVDRVERELLGVVVRGERHFQLRRQLALETSPELLEVAGALLLVRQVVEE